ncbi:hypothetical protein ACS0TY_029193 [Phlomoides rotata]
MTTDMGPPPPKPATTTTAAAEPSTSESPKATVMGPPLPRNPNPSQPEPEPEPEPVAESSENKQKELQLSPPRTDALNSAKVPDSTGNLSNGAKAADVEKKQEYRSSNTAVPYTIPPWSGSPGHRFFLEVIKDGSIINRYDVNEKGAYMFGRVDLCDFVLDHPTISRFHAVLQFKSNEGAYLYDLGSTHGTFINKNQVKKRIYVDLHVGDVIRFGLSSRLYIFQGPLDLMPEESDLKRLRKARIRQDMQDMEASLLRAKIEASRADGISWGMGEDAVEENEDDVEEITWQTYKGQLTEKQEKTRDKVVKRLEKIAHMKKEIDAIRVKDIGQGGLTQGQQTQIARNEQRISQLLEELENLEETLNESIRESLGARTGKLSHGKKRGTMEDEEDYISDDDEFYDRTQKSSKNMSGVNQAVETADSLLDKKNALTKQIEDKEKLLQDEDKPTEINEVAEAGDALDAYMSTVSSQLVSDKKGKILKELSTLQSELDRILYLLKIADPTGEAARKRESEKHKPKTIVTLKPASAAGKSSSTEKNQKLVPSLEESKSSESEGLLVKSTQEKSESKGLAVKTTQEKATGEAKSESDLKKLEPESDLKKAEPESDLKKAEPESVNDESTTAVHTGAKPQWLGAVEERKKEEIKQAPEETQETDQFVDYKDRATILNKENQGLEDAAPGLIIRKRKKVEKPNISDVEDSEKTSGSEFKAEDAVALLLKHSKGHHAEIEDDKPIIEDVIVENQGKKDGKKAKRALGPEKPSFLNEPDYTTWVPPEGQSGDGRTSLNDRFGY